MYLMSPRGLSSDIGVSWDATVRLFADYKFASLESSRPFFGEHRVHSGFLCMFKILVGEVEEEVRRIGPRLLTLTGHSLGGAVAALLALHLHRKVGVRAEVVLFASPPVGDEAFVADLAARVESRHIVYVGQGWESDMEGIRRYTLGDAIVQFGCAAMRGCAGLGAGTRADEYKVGCAYKAGHLP
jgi:pimeloyl-ACP methyl ester carboxylesterase